MNYVTEVLFYYVSVLYLLFTLLFVFFFIGFIYFFIVCVYDVSSVHLFLSCFFKYEMKLGSLWHI